MYPQDRTSQSPEQVYADVHAPKRGIQPPTLTGSDLDWATPPFESCAELERTIQRLDEWTSAFIGRMLPYSTPANQVPERMREAGGYAIVSDASPLEQRVMLSVARIGEVINALDDMNARLRL